MKLNGNLVLNSAGGSEIQNMVIERLAAAPTAISSEIGRIYFNTTSALFYYNSDGTTWMPFATGGNATALQNEVDYLEAALGATVNSAGNFVQGTWTGPYTAGATTLTGVIQNIEAALVAHNTLAELDDVALATPTNNQFLVYNNSTSKWNNHTLVLADVTDVTASVSEVNQLTASGITTADLVKLHAVTSTAVELNKLTGATVSTAEINTLFGSNTSTTIQAQLDNKQPLDAQLTSIAALTPDATSSFLLGGTGGTYSLQTAAGFRTALGVALGVNVQAWDADLDTIAGFAPAADSSETLTINGISTTHAGQNDIMVGTGSAVEGARWTLKREASARTSLGLGNIAILDESQFIRADGANNSNIVVDINFNNNKLVGLKPGTAGTDAVNLNQLEAAIAGLSWKQAVRAATIADITLSGTQTIDGVILAANDRVLVKNQALAKDNGIYKVASGAWTRTTDLDQAAEFEGAAVLVEEGGQQYTAWTETAAITTVGTDAVTWAQFNGANGLTAGVGLALTGNTIDVNLGAGIAQLPSDEVGIDLYDPTSSAIILTTDATTRSTTTAAKLHLLLDLTGNGKLVQSAAGVKVDTNTITEAELTASVAGNGLVGGNGTALAVVSAAGTGSVGGDTPASWTGVGTIVVTPDAVGVQLGDGSTQAAPGNHTHKAAAITFSNTASALLATNVQAAIDEIDGRVDTIESNASNLLSEVNAVEAAVGLNTNGTLNAWSGTTFLDASTTFKGALTVLDSKIEALRVAANARLSKLYYSASQSSATTWTVSHGLNQQYVNVTIYDGSGSVIIPQSIDATDANTVTVTFNQAVAGRIVVMGVGFADITL